MILFRSQMGIRKAKSLSEKKMSTVSLSIVSSSQIIATRYCQGPTDRG